MSSGNLYRTSPSKEALVEGLCARNQQEQIARFTHLADSDSGFAAVTEGLRKHIAALQARRQARLIVEIWTEAARIPAIAAMSGAIAAGILSQIEFIKIAKKRGKAASIDAATAARFIFAHADSLLKRLPLEPDFDAEGETGLTFLLFKALCSGAVVVVGAEQLQ
jgi:TetR/AcrR family transcriptional repressor of uid operon